MTLNCFTLFFGTPCIYNTCNYHSNFDILKTCYLVDELIDEKCLHKTELIDESFVLTRWILISNMVSVLLLLILVVTMRFRKF